MLFGGGGARGGGGKVIIGGRDLSMAMGMMDGVRARLEMSSMTDDSVDSMDCLRSE